MTRLIIYVFPTDRLSAGTARPWACGGVPGGVCSYPAVGARTPQWAPVPAGGRPFGPACAWRAHPGNEKEPRGRGNVGTTALLWIS